MTTQTGDPIEYTEAALVTQSNLSPHVGDIELIRTHPLLLHVCFPLHSCLNEAVT